MLVPTNKRALTALMTVLALLVGAAGAKAGSRAAPGAVAGESPVASALASALARAGANRGELDHALARVPGEQREGLEFLIRHMPEHDLRSLGASVLLEEVDLAYRAFERAPWRGQVPHDVFLNDVLPYCVVSETRTPWRKELYARSRDIVADAATPGEAAVRLNQEIFPRFGVRYSQERSRTDQNPIQVLAEGKATCTGLSVLLIAACRSVGVPARLAGIPLWPDSSGNHSWVEVWDQGWHYTGAAEPTGDRLDEAWFTEASRGARPDVPAHSIYATSYARTGLLFPLAWDEDGSIDYVHAVDVTGRYLARTPRAGWGRPARTVSR